MESFEEFQNTKKCYAQLESGTLEALMKDMEQNHGSVRGIFAMFRDSLDRWSVGAVGPGTLPFKIKTRYRLFFAHFSKKSV